MTCLEVWGGNQAVDNGVVMAGLDAWLYSRPFHDHAAGGDIYYVSSCALGQLTRVLVADVSGHGEAVSDTAHRLRALMRRYVNFVDQTRFVEGLNTEFSGLSEADGFATAVAATYFIPTDQLTVCNAGHPRPLWYRTRTRTWTLMPDAVDKQPLAASAGGPAANMPLGIAGPTRYEQFAVKLATGDLVVFYTDSLIEAKGADGKPLGEEGLLAMARQLDVADVAEFLRALLSSVERHGESSADDVTVLILRPNGLKPRASLPVKLKALTHMAAAFFASLRASGPEFPAAESGLFSVLGRLSQRVRRRRTGTPALRTEQPATR
jgi:serine phosphatase RsbU (regulator of sigma subunit)